MFRQCVLLQTSGVLLSTRRRSRVLSVLATWPIALGALVCRNQHGLAGLHHTPLAIRVRPMDQKGLWGLVTLRHTHPNLDFVIDI